MQNNAKQSRQRAAMTASLEKGNQLERAVAAIEHAILSSSPSLAESAFVIESNKVIVSSGVRHEIDIWIRVEAGKGYASVFIFECKNWEEKVGKNEIIIFAEKIFVTNAQKGFFVAKSFTKDAEAQAAKDPRIELIVAENLPIENVPVPFDFHFALQDVKHTNLILKERGSINERDPVPCQVQSPKTLMNGNEVQIADLLGGWSDEICHEHLRTFSSGRLPDGLYPMTVKGEKHFQSQELIVDGRDIETAALEVQCQVKIVRPTIISYFNVETRGRAIQLSSVDHAGTSMQVTYIET